MLIPAATAPTTAVSFAFDLNENVHALLAEVVHGALADIFEVGAARGDDVDYAEDVGGMRVMVIVIVIVIIVAVGIVVMTVSMAVVVSMIVIVIVAMAMTVVASMIMSMGMSMSMSMVVVMMMVVVAGFLPRIVQPELWDGVPDNAP